MRRSRSDGSTDRRRGGWLLLGAALLSAQPTIRLAAQEPPLNTGALFLVFPVGAQAVGMGQTGMAAGGTGEAAFWNPAGLATLAHDEFAVHSATLVAGRSHVLGAYFRSNGIGVIGGALYLVDYGDLERTDNNGNTIARIAPRNFEFLASYATALMGSFVLGINYKLIQFRVDCSGDCRGFPAGAGTTHALDLGGQFRIGSGVPLRIGVAVRNVGFKLQVQNQAQADPLPTRVVIGALYELQLRPAGGAAADEHFDLKLAADIDSPWGGFGGTGRSGGGGQAQTRVGLDIGYQQLLRVRAGYAFVQDGLNGPSIGLGIATGSIGVDLARAFLSDSDLEVENPTFFSFRVTF